MACRRFAIAFFDFLRFVRRTIFLFFFAAKPKTFMRLKRNRSPVAGNSRTAGIVGTSRVYQGIINILLNPVKLYAIRYIQRVLEDFHQRGNNRDAMPAAA